ncbi:hypothetical protein [Leptothoe spongobia]|uniref:Uncharacterized protein n=1 Tax=Leptothoe spongobia TAU-MAC 1115 TaxID=1967444 RepID=A0A947DGH1_9CYAN|nr:hypothetical protein [Leptothoe spongobia]MBT9316490.1 hypothetical protein [Leptothoe spongobia TAU-MAC 1115]
MTDIELGPHLHDRATRGEQLTSEEQQQLDAWYAEQDVAEMSLLQEPDSPTNLATIHLQIETVLSQLAAVAEHIQQLTSENQQLRTEISVLQQQLVSAQSA